MKGASVSKRDTQGTGDYPLHLLINVFNKNPTAAKKIMQFLAEAGADLNAKNDD